MAVGNDAPRSADRQRVDGRVAVSARCGAAQSLAPGGSGRAIDAVVVALTILKPVAAPQTTNAATTTDLISAVLRQGLTLRDLVFLAGVSEQRVLAIAAGAPATPAETLALKRVLPDWTGGGQ